MEPGGRDLKCYPVRVEGDTILVEAMTSETTSEHFADIVFRKAIENGATFVVVE